MWRFVCLGANINIIEMFVQANCTWIQILRLWPIEERPEDMQKPDFVNGLTFDQAIKWKEHYEQQVKKEGKGDTSFGKDSNIPSRHFEAGEDDCKLTLHLARFQRAPVTERKHWWALMPNKLPHVYRRLALEHSGAAGKVSEVAIVRAHDRTLPLAIKMFYSNNRTQRSFNNNSNKDAAADWETPKATLDIQEAIQNYGDVMGELWPLDNTPRILNRVLINYGYGASLKGADTVKCRLILDFCDTVLRENASRAIALEPPLSYREAKERWADITERLPAPSSSNSYTAGGGNGTAQRGFNRAGRGGANNGRAGGQLMNRGARFSAGGLSYPVCFAYNRPSGCPNPAPGVGCDDKRGGFFAHVCNFYDRGTNKYCLSAHPRHSNH